MTPDITKALAIPGWMSEGELTWLATTAQTCQTILEIGSYLGRSTRALADACPGHVYVVDTWTNYAWVLDPTARDGDAVYRRCQQNLAPHLDTGHVTLWRGRSLDLTIWQQVPPCDLIFLDGDHSYGTVIQEIQLWAPRVKPGGILSGHDYGAPSTLGVTRAVQELYGQPDALHESIWVKRL